MTNLHATESASDSKIQQMLYHYRIGMLDKQGDFKPVRISLSPFEITPSEWANAIAIAHALSKLMQAISERPAFLLSHLEALKNTNTLMAKLVPFLATQKNTVIAKNRMIARHDLVLTQSRHWKLIESNTIAAGMGPLCQRLVSLQRDLNPSLKLIENPAITTQASALYDEACSVRQVDNPNIVFVVEKQEDNVFDQALLADAIRKLGARVEFCTLQVLKSTLRSEHKLLFLTANTPLDLLYFRTGYNLKDYQDDQGDTEKLLAFRHWIELHQVIVCPSISGQLSSCKWIQGVLSGFSEQDFQSQFELSSEEANLCFSVLSVEHKIPQSATEIEQALASGDWILKGHGEGGGNVQIKSNKELIKRALGDKSILMKKIDLYRSDQSTHYYQNNSRKTISNTTSEVGVFTSGAQHDYAGYLIRTKPINEIECGVHRGMGMISCLRHR